MLDNRSSHCSTSSAGNKGSAATKGKTAKSYENNCISHVVAFWVMTALPVGFVAFMLLGAKLL
jgi:hypothetical protein